MVVSYVDRRGMKIGDQTTITPRSRTRSVPKRRSGSAEVRRGVIQSRRRLADCHSLLAVYPYLALRVCFEWSYFDCPFERKKETHKSSTEGSVSRSGQVASREDKIMPCPFVGQTTPRN